MLLCLQLLVLLALLLSLGGELGLVVRPPGWWCAACLAGEFSLGLQWGKIGPDTALAGRGLGCFPSLGVTLGGLPVFLAVDLEG